MNSVKFFDTSGVDPQGTIVEPVSIDRFDVESYAEYAKGLEAGCRAFLNSREGILVHRRFRVPAVFAGNCRDMKWSLEAQLSALDKSVDYAMDVPNFLEPWYGIGTVAAAFGAEYRWEGDLAPVIRTPFHSVEEALAQDPIPLSETGIGRHTLNMIEYFLEKTKGKLPMSLSDVQSPLNAASALVDTTEFFMTVMDSPESVTELLERVVDISIEFYRKQVELIGDALVRPGHGFSSSRVFSGIGLSDDNSTMLSPGIHEQLCGPSMLRFGNAFGGTAYHSCGDWSRKVDTLRNMHELKMVDGAFTSETDPDPNPAGPFGNGFAGTGITVNARMVGPPERVAETVAAMWKPGMKIIAVSYCADPDDQQRLYEILHEKFGNHDPKGFDIKSTREEKR